MNKEITKKEADKLMKAIKNCYILSILAPLILKESCEID